MFVTVLCCFSTGLIYAGHFCDTCLMVQSVCEKLSLVGGDKQER